MKQLLTAEESAELIKMGVDQREASHWDLVESMDGLEGIPIFTIEDIIALLPKRIIDRNTLYYLNVGIDSYQQHWCASYRGGTYDSDDLDTFQSSEELCDVLFALLKWIIENPEYTKL